MRSFEYSRASTLEDAFASLARNGASRALAGGTDLLPLMKADVAAPSHLIDLKHLDALAGGIVHTSGGGLSLGALTPLAEIEQHPLIRERFPMLAEAAASAATMQLRN